MNYKKVYEFMVQEEVETGKDVYCLDKQEKEVLHVNVLGMEFALKLIHDAKDNDRYEFWKEIKEDAEEL